MPVKEAYSFLFPITLKKHNNKFNTIKIAFTTPY